jgi:outer membrane protein OmpA-like peptidoglycan-associated protein
MSTAPMLSSGNLKSFWSRPEGKVGAVVLLGLAALANGGIQSAPAEQVNYSAAVSGGQVLGHKAVYINFATGSDQPLSTSLPTLDELKDQLAINQQLALQLDGYTNNTGSDSVNIPLSQARAFAVKRYFQTKAPLSFPDSRFKSVSGHGSQNPIAADKALNRRVEVTQIGE